MLRDTIRAGTRAEGELENMCVEKCMGDEREGESNTDWKTGKMGDIRHRTYLSTVILWERQGDGVAITATRKN